MPRITVRGYASLGDILGHKDLDLSVDAATVAELVAYMGRNLSQSFPPALLDSARGDVMKGNKVLVNGRDVDFLQGLATKLKDGDRVVFFPLVGGG